MSTYPDRCQHIKTNGTQCGSPALRRNRFCYFHKRHHEQRIALSADRAKTDRRRLASIDLPVLEDANSIQSSLMQVIRLLLSGQLDPKTAGLLLYALQTAAANLSRTNFEPNMHQIILSPADAAETPLGDRAWEDDDFEDEDEDEDDDAEDNDEEGEDDESEDDAPDKAAPAKRPVAASSRYAAV